MKEGDFRVWLERRFAPAVAASRFANCRTVEREYGDLDEAIDSGQIGAIIEAFTYTTGDARAGRPNPSRIAINGDIRTGLATLKAAVKLYTQFRQGTEPEDIPSPSDPDGIAPEPELQVIGLERDLQAALRSRIDQLEPGLIVIDGGAERRVASGFIDILAQDSSGSAVVIELKAGQAGPSAVSQIAAYMGDVLESEPDSAVRGIIVASDFDHRAQAAARMVPTLRLFRYGVTFAFSEVGR